MSDILPFLKQLISAPGLSGYENPIRKIIETTWAPITDELSISKIGSLHGLQRGSGAKPRPSIMIATHMDAIGLMVNGIVDGFLHITEIGGIDPRVLPGQPVTIHGREDIHGVVIQPPARLLPPKYADNPVPLEYLLVDTGLPASRINKLVRIGDLISFAQPPIEISDEILAGHSLDNRASVAALTYCLEELRNRPHTWDVWAVATAQEEETLGGAHTSTFQLSPGIAVAMDVTFAQSPGSPNHKTFPQGKGPTIGLGPNIHPAIHKDFVRLAEKLEIPYSVEPMPRFSGTDAIAMQVTAEGIPCIVIGIPLRYMHTPVEMVSVKDIQRAGRLLAEFIAQLEPNYLEKITWDD